MSNTQKYLKRYAEPEVDLLKQLPGSFSHCVCIPAYNESPEFIQRLINFLACHGSTLAIVVLNQPDSDKQLVQNNVHCKTYLQQQNECVWHKDYLQLYSIPASAANKNCAVLLVDRFDQGLPIPKKQGVGLARKIATDIALQLIEQKIIQSQWIYSTDADTLLPDNYFQRPDQNDNQSIAAFVLAYQHISGGDVAIDDATQLYEQRLKAYVDGLKFAGSPYAFNTVGSTLCINASHYAMVRGFPKRAAGEDFYLLNKLRKTGEVIELDQPTVQIESRVSHRTPFGTGPAVDEILSKQAPSEVEIFYHPQLFTSLKTLLQGFDDIASGFSSNEKKLAPWQSAFADSELIIKALELMDFDRAIKHCSENSRNSKQFAMHLTHWFDGFRTLKWLHLFRDIAGYQKICLQQYESLVMKISNYPNSSI